MTQPNLMATLAEVVADDDPGRLLRIEEVMHEVGMTRSTIYRKISAGTFPGPIRIDGNMSRWWESDVKAWKKALRDSTKEPPEKPGTKPGIDAKAA